MTNHIEIKYPECYNLVTAQEFTQMEHGTMGIIEICSVNEFENLLVQNSFGGRIVAVGREHSWVVSDPLGVFKIRVLPKGTKIVITVN